jgi:cytochrome c oxidase subunit 3
VGLNVDADALRKFCMTKPQAPEKAETFAQFWRHYLRDHAQAGTRVLHFVGTGLGVAALILGIVTLDPWHFPLLNTLILLTSGTTVTWAHHALLHNDRKGLINGLWLTIILGATFTCVQAYEYYHAAFNYSGHIYGATFFMATGFHGFHVLVGTIFLIVCLIRAYAGHFSPTQHLGFEFAAWYWHFVDVVWLFLFICIYVWGHGAETMAHGAH